MSEAPKEHGIPHGEALGIVSLGAGPRRARCLLPWRVELVGHPAIGSIFSGAVWALLDQTLGAACFASIGPQQAVATSDRRVDYLRPSRSGRALLALGECTRLTRQVAFARGEVHHEDEPDAEPLALAQGTFMIYERPLEWAARRA
jgi:uncharacterized protein (TIGR00369 family)